MRTPRGAAPAPQEVGVYQTGEVSDRAFTVDRPAPDGSVALPVSAHHAVSGVCPRWEVAGADLLREVVRVADLTDELELALQPVGVALGVEEDALEELAAPVVTQAAAALDAIVVSAHVLELRR